jgi:adenylate cyclase
MLDALVEHKFRIALILLVFVLFLLGTSGLIDIHLYFSSGFRLNENILSHVLSRLQLIPRFESLEFIMFICTGLLLSFSLPLLSPIKASSLTLTTMLFPVYLAFSQQGSGNFVSMEYQLLTILMLFVVNVLVSYFIETRDKQQLIAIFGQYVPRELVNRMSAHPDKISLAGEARELTVLFCDIKGFTEISEKLDPRQLAAFLNAYFTGMTRILYKHGATIDKYMGDAIMAFWGAPLPQVDHARHAVSAALEMQAALIPLAEEFTSRGWPVIELGIGINTGVMNVGNMGSEYRVAYTVVGDAVNLGSRLEHLTRKYQVRIIVSEATRRASDDFLFRELDQVKVKGKEKITRIYEPIGLLVELQSSTAGGLITERLGQHDIALQHYYQQDWDEAERIFTELHSSTSNPYYYELFLKRISAFRCTPPPADWSGATTYNTL